MSAQLLGGHLSGGWGAFYDKPGNDGNPHLRTYEGRQAEKFYEVFKEPYVPPRAGKPPPPDRPPSLTWGVGGTQPCGRMRLEAPAAVDFHYSQKRYLTAGESGEMGGDSGEGEHGEGEGGSNGVPGSAKHSAKGSPLAVPKASASVSSNDISCFKYTNDIQ
mgnify:CR=1 FL=1